MGSLFKLGIAFAPKAAKRFEKIASAGPNERAAEAV
jgi:hypothetical protein